MEPTSEQELKELLDEGKITEEEYHGLLEALHQKQTARPQPPFQQQAESKSPAKYGKAALILFVLSVALPIFAVLLLFVLNWLGIEMLPAVPFFLIGLLCAFLAFIFGIIGWKTTQGKIAAIAVPCLGFLCIPGLFLLWLLPAYNVPGTVEITHAKQSEMQNLISHQVYPLDSLDGVLTQDAELDDQISADGNGSLRIQTDSGGKTVVRLFETGPMGIDNRMLIYQAKIKSNLSIGKAYLEMWCDIPGKGEFFSRGLQNPVAGTTHWTTVQTPFHLETGQIPANIKLNLVIEGQGTIWVDDIKLLSSQL